ncbi:MAG: ATP-binding protein [Candidatus Protochlamydia sp.]|nr:ATP-binding protein [Candidatus Protochlamydia sp.]
MGLEDLFKIHREVMSTVEIQVKRYVYEKINWSAHATCILGDRGVGKTTLMCQKILEEYKFAERALYISADNIHVNAQGLFNIAQNYFTDGGEGLFIDEIHKYPNWSIELKNIIDTYKKCKIVFSASSSLDLNKSKADLSRRVVYHQLLGLSFREFILLTQGIDLPVLTLNNIFQNHVEIAEGLHSLKILKLFRDYLVYGYYPFFLEGTQDYLSKLNNVIEKVIFEDIAVIFKLKQTTLPILKKILWLVATTDGLIPNIDQISSSIGISREIVYNCLDHLGHSGLLNNLYPAGKGLKIIRKPGKIFMNNTNLLYAINRNLQRNSGSGGIRETFFANQVSAFYKVNVHTSADFIIDDRYIIEVGGRNKDHSQIKNLADSFLALDDIEVGYKNKIPLYLFGFLY